MTLDDKVREACHRIEDIYHETGGKCFLSFSGGKDSTVLLALIKLCEEVYTIPPNAIPAVFSNTGIELDITIDFVKWVKENYYSNVQIIHPVKPFAWVMQNEGKPVKSKIKSVDLRQYHYGKRSAAIEKILVEGKTMVGKSYKKHRIADMDMHMLHDDFTIKASRKCCDYMKKKPFEKYIADTGMLGNIQGVRMAEGGARDLAANQRLKNGGKLCTWLKNGVIQKAPIIDWSDGDVDEFIQKYNVPLSKAYTEYGFTRTGCMACPYAKDVDNDLKYLYSHEPNRYKAALYFLKDVYIAQGVKLPFDADYERERLRIWTEQYGPMRQEMLQKYRPNSRLLNKEVIE